MRFIDLFISAVWSFTARPGRMGALCVALACTLASVATLAAVVQGYSKEIETLNFGDLARSIVIRENLVMFDRFGPPSLDHARAVQERVEGVTGAVAWRHSFATVRHQSNELNLPLYGVLDLGGQVPASLAPGEGRSFTPAELTENYPGERRVCLLGAAARRKLCGEGRTCGISEIRINGVECKIIGVLPAPQRVTDYRLANAVITPFFSAARIFERGGSTGIREAERIEFRIGEDAKLASVRSAVGIELRSLYGAPVSAPAPFEFDDNSGAAEVLSRQRSTFARLLLIVIATAGVGGFVTFTSVMASMVNERRREISLRTAYGARAEDIVLQFMAEAAMVAAVGAALASALSLGLGQVLGRLGDAPVSVNGAVLGLASGLALLIALAAALPIALGAVERRAAADRS